MANIKITGYVELAAIPNDADMLEIVDDVAGTPTSKKISAGNLRGGLAASGANADITSITRATGGAFNISIGGAAGDDFTIDADKLVVEGDTGRVGIGTTNPSTAKLQVVQTVSDMFAGYFENSHAMGSYGVVIKAGDDSGNYALSVRDKDDNNLMRVRGDGNVGIGTTAPENPLAVNRSADGIIVDFESADIVEGNVSIAGNTTSYNAFVGSHYTQLKSGQKELPIGAVVISTGEIIPCEANIPEITEAKVEILGKDVFEIVEAEIDLVIEKIIDGKIQKSRNKIGEEFKEYRIVDGKVIKIMKPIYEKTTIQKTQLKKDHELDAKVGKIYKKIRIEEIISKNVFGKEYFTYIDTTTKPADKAVYGVWLGKMSDDAKGMSFGNDNKPVYLIAQVGLFRVRVTDTQGDIEIGDFLETSSRPMEAQRQISKQKESSTIAKAMINVDWSKEVIDSELGYKWKLIPCIF